MSRINLVKARCRTSAVETYENRIVLGSEEELLEDGRRRQEGPRNCMDISIARYDVPSPNLGDDIDSDAGREQCVLDADTLALTIEKEWNGQIGCVGSIRNQ